MRDTEDHRQRYGADAGGEREKPCRSRWCLGDRPDRLHRGIRCQPASLDIPDRLHRRRDTIHVDAGRIGCHLRHEVGTLVVELELEFAPARHHLGVQSDRPPEPLGRDHGLLRCLPVDEEDFGKGEDEFAVRLRGHASLARIVQ